jgi:hypothetical protein
LLAIAQAPKQEFRFVIRGQSRSRASANVITLKRSDRLTLSIEFDPAPGLKSPRAELKSDSQELPIVIPVNIGPNDDSVVFSVPAANLASGSYSVVLSGQMQDGSSKELASGTLQLQVTD